MDNVFEYIRKYDGIKKWKGIVIHHSQTKDRTLLDCVAIKKFHINIRGWKDIGYHFVLEIVNGVYRIEIGRPLSVVGAHEPKVNRSFIGVCLVGNYDLYEPSHQQYFILASLCRELMRKFNIQIENILPHWAYADKTCPGNKYNFPKFKNYIRGVYNG